jgi:hypothetical protein
MRRFLVRVQVGELEKPCGAPPSVAFLHLTRAKVSAGRFRRSTPAAPPEFRGRPRVRPEFRGVPASRIRLAGGGSRARAFGLRAVGRGSRATGAVTHTVPVVAEEFPRSTRNSSFFGCTSAGSSSLRCRSAGVPGPAARSAGISGRPGHAHPVGGRWFTAAGSRAPSRRPCRWRRRSFRVRPGNRPPSGAHRPDPPPCAAAPPEFRGRPRLRPEFRGVPATRIRLAGGGSRARTFGLRAR